MKTQTITWMVTTQTHTIMMNTPTMTTVLSRPFQDYTQKKINNHKKDEENMDKKMEN